MRSVPSMSVGRECGVLDLRLGRRQPTWTGYSIYRTQPGPPSLGGELRPRPGVIGAREELPSPGGRASFLPDRCGAAQAAWRSRGRPRPSALDTATGLAARSDDHRDRREPENLAADATGEQAAPAPAGARARSRSRRHPSWQPRQRCRRPRAPIERVSHAARGGDAGGPELDRPRRRASPRLRRSRGTKRLTAVDLRAARRCTTRTAAPDLARRR